MAEAPVEPVAHDNQSLGPGAEGPDKPEDQFHHFCKLVVSATPLDKRHCPQECLSVCVNYHLNFRID